MHSLVKIGAARAISSPSSFCDVPAPERQRRGFLGISGAARGREKARRCRGASPGCGGRHIRGWRRRRGAARPPPLLSTSASRAAADSAGADHAAGDQGIVDGAAVAGGVGGPQLAARPELARAEVDHGLDHVHRRRVGRRLGPAGLAHDHVDLGEPAEDHVARLQVVDRLGHRRARNGDRHVHDHPLVERRHELARQRLHLLLGDQGHDQQAGGGSDRDPAAPRRVRALRVIARNSVASRTGRLPSGANPSRSVTPSTQASAAGRSIR